MSFFRRILIIFIACGAVSVIFLTWYSGQHARDETLPTTDTNAVPLQKVLLAADNVDVKDSLIREVIHGLESRKVTIEVYKLSDLSEIDKNEWAAIIVFQKADPLTATEDRIVPIKTFANGLLVVLHGDHSYALHGGSIPSPMVLKGVQTTARQIVEKVQELVDLGKGT
jgi:hypothetical protein